ncbi:cell division protein ZapA [Aerococcaceae bacterium DSM 111020]|nr:cell division protein ZapA [Aerococcaceae bacterium DSM 111020]
MNQKNRFKATIDERQYTIVGDKSTQHMTAVIEIVNQQLQQLKEAAPELSIQDRSILMAVNAISDQLVKEQQIMDLEEQLETLTQQQRPAKERNIQTPTRRSSDSTRS